MKDITWNRATAAICFVAFFFYLVCMIADMKYFAAVIGYFIAFGKCMELEGVSK